ncbi:hypothetical protein C9374_008581 [Naegleria lovaniensis]|uniref:Endoglycoceramidase n=1 Tax=Naegleria lovaniensis TaxID=51637 RepID=A0AA88GI72_NAELO|nr:uncharacterized protein C9374_008581 [Naegleria lovaniensis]KAG2377959.1 hypothetical protein C9374_008581 [Naegleria lovaniensis]
MFRNHSRESFVAVLLLVVFLNYSLTLVDCFIRVNTPTQQFMDETNRTRIFHGVNVVYKIAPFHPDRFNFNTNTSLTDKDLQNLRNWGFNVIRLYLSWEGTEPRRGQYNTNYLATLRDIVRQCEKYGIMVILDVHQDVMSDLFCGEGFPRWAVQYSTPDFPYPFNNIHLRINQTTHAPVVSDCLQHAFFQYYLTTAASNAFQNFYDNMNGVRDAFADFWKYSANYFKDEPNVLGLEIINEPFAGDIYADLGLLLDQTGKADRKNLLPLYKQVYQSIRSVNNNHLVFFEQAVTDLLSSGFDESPLGTQDLDKQVFSYHVYCFDVNSTGDPNNRFLCQIGDDAVLGAKEYDVKRFKTGGFMTEFGALSNFTQSAHEIEWITGLADEYLRSWTYWQFKYYNDVTTAASPPTIESFYGPNGELQSRKVKALSRTYAQAVCGNPTRMTFDPAFSEFYLSFNYVKSLNCDSQPTVVYFNQEFYYPTGFNVQVTPPNALSVKQSEMNYLQFFVRSENVVDGQQIQIQITRTN